MKNLIILITFLAASLFITNQENIAIGGYDPVSYFEGEPVKGDPAFEWEWQGMVWLFTTQNNMKLFQNDPHKYAPQNSGNCPIAERRQRGQPLLWKIDDGKLYLFCSKTARDNS
jgi:YHS domain-containing protein